MVNEALARAGVSSLLDPLAATSQLRAAGVVDSRSCQGTRGCLSRLASLLGPRAVVVGVDVGKVGKTLALHIEAVAADQETSLAVADVTAPYATWTTAFTLPVSEFSRKVKEGLLANPADSSTPPLAQTEAPRRADLTPPPVVGALSFDGSTPAQAPRPRIVPWALTAGAVAAAGGSLALGILSADARERWSSAQVPLPDGTQGTRLTADDARALASSANTTTALSISSAILSAGLAATATWLFLRE